MSTINFKSSDGEIFPVEVECAKQSVIFRSMLEDIPRKEDDDAIPLPNLTSAVLKKVIEWVTYHKDDPPQAEAEGDKEEEMRTDNISAWDREFLKVDHEELFEIILAANFLEIRGLLDVGCKTVANLIKDKTPEEVKMTFSFNNNLAPPKEKKAKMENE